MVVTVTSVSTFSEFRSGAFNKQDSQDSVGVSLSYGVSDV